MPLLVLAAISHVLEDWVGEVGHEIGIEYHHIDEQGLPALAIAALIGTAFF